MPILFGIIFGSNLLKKIVFFPVILSQCLSPLRPSAHNLRVHYEIVPLKTKCKYFSRYLLILDISPGWTDLSKAVTINSDHSDVMCHVFWKATPTKKVK